ncbi:succinate--CoA ligase subunit alpha [Candidatus Bathyarchaeota archaeon]|nr:succinate--CoA ligase subunit alpha [Candidatus Bathyarchaeota archaeon]
MTILVDENTRVIVQGITGRIGSVQTRLMLNYGTKIVAGVTPGKGGQTVEGIPVYNTVSEALKEHPADSSIIFVPATFAKDAAFEAINAGLKLLVIITEHIPVHDTMKIKAMAERHGVTVLGPNTPGIISPGKTKLGIMPGNLYMPGEVGIVARSATLSYEIAGNLTEAGIGQTTCLGIGGDLITGVTFVDVLKMFEADHDTKAIVIVGEIGRTVEEEAAKFIEGQISKPVVAFIAGRYAPLGKRMGHAGAIIERGRGTVETKITALREAGVKVIERPMEIVSAIRDVFKHGLT